MIKIRNKLHKEAIEENCGQKFEKYKKLRNEINGRLEKDRHEYYKTKFYQENPSISTIWRNANDYLNTSKRSFSNTPTMIKSNQRIVTSPREVANALNNTFLKQARVCNKLRP